MGLVGVTASWSTLLFLVLLVRANSHDHDELSTSGGGVNHTALESSWFFNIDDLKAGKRMAVHFATKEESIRNHFLPRDQADSIPFSLENLPEILASFGYPRGSPRAKAVEATLRTCGRPPASETFKACFTSYESMLDSVLTVLFTDRPTPLTTTIVSGGGVLKTRSFRNYTILEVPREVPTEKMMGCHALPYPYTVFYCHRQPGVTRVFRVLLGGDGDELVVDAVAACHLDTSRWDADTLPFRALGTKPGDPVCHFFPPHGNIAWVHTTNSARA